MNIHNNKYLSKQDMQTNLNFLNKEISKNTATPKLGEKIQNIGITFSDVPYFRNYDLIIKKSIWRKKIKTKKNSGKSF